jgi:LAO/AO transport system kinase
MNAANRLRLEEYVAGVTGGDRSTLGRAITLIESTRAEDRVLARDLMRELLPHAGKAHRIGITGVPGVGKSTFIEAFGKLLTGQGHQVAVLAVDPSSARSGGSILGDKTRMQELARDPNAFVRPSPAAGALGGVARHTREAIALCEAAGFDVVLVETVGVGQSEVMVADMVDFFLVLMLAGGGDDLQGIKRGILEVADMVAINKADGDNLQPAKRARATYEDALRLMQPRSEHWKVPVVTCSALQGDGLPEIWSAIEAHRGALDESGEWEQARAEQRVRWMWRAIDEGLRHAFREDPDIASALSAAEDEVRRGAVTPDEVAQRLLDAFRRAP